MAREGYLLVDSRHSLFPKAVATRIENRAQQVVETIESSHSITLPTIRFVLKPHALGGRSVQSTAETLFSGSTHPHVRLIFSRAEISSKLLQESFANSKLLLLILEVDHPPHNVISGKIGPARARFHVTQDRSERMIEDIILDVTLGNLFGQSGPVKHAIDRRGHGGLYRLKAQFAKGQLDRSWLAEIAKRAEYATLASLNTAADDDISGRATAAYSSWLEFSEWLEPRIRLPSQRTRTVADSLQQLRRLGGQLPLRRIEARLAELPDGQYALLVLRSASSARKSPSMKRRIQSIFGKSARINTFRFIPVKIFRSRYRMLSQLVASSHISIFNLDVRADNIFLSEGEP